MTLKTLKDIDFNEYVESNSNYQTREEFIRYKLKVEAIKWVKFRNIKIDTDFCEFLDITEEDLQ